MVSDRLESLLFIETESKLILQANRVSKAIRLRVYYPNCNRAMEPRERPCVGDSSSIGTLFINPFEPE